MIFKESAEPRAAFVLKRGEYDNPAIRAARGPRRVAAAARPACE